MIFISHYFLKNFGNLDEDSLHSYAIAVGIMTYASVYVYLLFNYYDYISIFNKFLIYVIGVDLLLSTFMSSKSSDQLQMIQCDNHSENHDDEDDESDLSTESYLSESESCVESDIEESDKETMNSESHSINNGNEQLSLQIINLPEPPIETINQDEPISILPDALALSNTLNMQLELSEEPKQIRKRRGLNKKQELSA